MKPLPDTLFKTPLVPAPKPKVRGFVHFRMQQQQQQLCPRRLYFLFTPSQVAGLPDLISPAFPSPPKTTAFITADTSPARPFASAISSSAVPRHGMHGDLTLETLI
jgi:hypothetical protein